MILEICVDSPAGLAAAIEGGADRIELCAALALGGLTPSPGLVRLAASAPVPVFAMIRPRAGSFVFGPDDEAAMHADIAHVRAANLAGVVLGASRPGGALDVAMLSRLLASAGPLGRTLHRAFDLTSDLDAALDQAIALGFHRVLTSGGAPAVAGGLPAVTAAVARGRGRIAIMAGGGVRPALVPALRQAGVTELHASCRAPAPADAQALAFGFGMPGWGETDVTRVRALRSATHAPTRAK